MKLIIGNRCFCPRLFTSVIAVLFFSLFVSLGFWQLDRAEQKRSVYAEFEKRQISSPINLDSDQVFQTGSSSFLWRPVYASGVFIEEKQFLLDNQVEQGQAGYFVYTPFQLAESKRYVLVNRGWVATGADRQNLPDLTRASGSVTISGVIKEVPKTGVLLKESKPEKMNSDFYRVQRVNIEELGGVADIALLPYILRLAPESEHGYRRQWQVPGSGESTNLGYAFQWFSFATVLLFMYLFMNLKKVSQDDTNGRNNE